MGTDIVRSCLLLIYITGSYSDSAGVDVIRQDIADFIARRDGHPSNKDHVFTSTGASDGIKVRLID